ncbi:MAG: hypothetical protein JJU18_08415 [Oceanicaulis sp.]|nr:hypothetical protein [Oceanicaulis sp.]
MMRYWLIAGGAALLAAACATTDDVVAASAADSAEFQVASPAEVERAEREGYDPNAIRCERERVIGSRLPARQVCRPEWEWRAIARGAQETMDHIQRLGIPSDPNDG